MASASRVERVKQIEDTELREQLLAALDLIDKMSSEKSPEEKKIESLLNVTTDDSVRQVLQSRLDSMRQDESMDLEDAIEEVANIGLIPIHVLQQGLSKHVNSKTHSALKAQESE